MNQELSKLISKIAFYGCWIAIIVISFILIDSSATPWNKTYFGVEIPKIDPLVHIDNRYHFPLHSEYINKEDRIDRPDFYSSISANSFVEVFYRPDFEGYPTHTLTILILRLVTYISLSLFFYFLSRILKSVYKGSPFSTQNYKRLLYMGLLMSLISIVRVVHSTVMADFLTENPKLLGWNIVGSYQGLWLLPFGLLLVILSYIFKELVRIHKEQKLTV